MQKRKTVRSRNTTKEAPAVSFCAAGKGYPLPADKDYAKEFERLKKIDGDERRKGREIVVVMGLGFVGAVMAGVIADRPLQVGEHLVGRPRPVTTWCTERLR